MAKVCEVCHKGPQAGQTRSHAMNITKRTFAVNLRSIRALQPGGGAKRTRVCTRCLRSDKVQKAG